MQCMADGASSLRGARGGEAMLDHRREGWLRTLCGSKMRRVPTSAIEGYCARSPSRGQDPMHDDSRKK